MSNAVQKKRQSSIYPYVVAKKRLTLGVQTAIGPVPIKGTIEVATQTAVSQNSARLVNSSNDICQSKWKATLYRPIAEYVYSPGTINYTQFLHPPAGSGRTVQIGQQDVWNLYNVFPLGDFIDNRFSGNGAVSTVQTGVTLRDSIFSLDINKKSTDGVGEAPTTSNVKSITNHMYLKNVKLDHQWVNASSNPLMIDIYWCLSMKNSEKSPYDQWQFQLDEEKQGQSNANQWSASVASPTAGKPSINHYGQEPTSIKGWTDFWRVLKKESITLQAGGRCNTQTTLRFNYLASQAIMESLATNVGTTAAQQPNYIAGLTVVPLVVARGFGIYVQGADPEIATYSYSGGRYGVITKQEYTFVPVKQEHKFPYQRVYNSVWHELWNPAREKYVAVQDVAVEAPQFIP